MRILFVNASLTEGGSERAMCLVANGMAREGHEVIMLCVRDKQQTYHVEPNIRLIQLRYSSFSKVTMILRRLKSIRRVVKKWHPDAVISFMWDINVMTLLATMGLRKLKKVISERAFPESSDRSKVVQFLERTIYGFADWIVYQTEDAKAYCPKVFAPKAAVIPNIVEPPIVSAFDGKRKNRIVSVGRLAPQKNFPLLIKAFARFSKEMPNYVLDIYGEGHQRKELEETIRREGMDNKVNLNGYVEDVASAINDASIFVLASNYEGISNAMTEAMAMGLPVICTDCPAGGAALVIESGVNGILVPVGDEDALLNAMILLAQNEELQNSLSRNAKQIVNTFSTEKIVGLWTKLLY